MPDSPTPPPGWRNTHGREPAPRNPSACVRLGTLDSGQIYILLLEACGGVGTLREVCLRGVRAPSPGTALPPHLVETSLPRGSYAHFELKVIELERIMRCAVSSVLSLSFLLVVLSASLPPVIYGRQAKVRTWGAVRRELERQRAPVSATFALTSSMCRSPG